MVVIISRQIFFFIVIDPWHTSDVFVNYLKDNLSTQEIHSWS